MSGSESNIWETGGETALSSWVSVLSCSESKKNWNYWRAMAALGWIWFIRPFFYFFFSYVCLHSQTICAFAPENERFDNESVIITASIKTWNSIMCNKTAWNRWCKWRNALWLNFKRLESKKTTEMQAASQEEWRLHCRAKCVSQKGAVRDGPCVGPRFFKTKQYGAILYNG